MSTKEMKEVIIRFRDDLDKSLDESVETYTFSWIHIAVH